MYKENNYLFLKYHEAASLDHSGNFLSCLALMMASLAFLYLSRICWVILCLAWAFTRLNIGAFLNIEGTITNLICDPRR